MNFQDAGLSHGEYVRIKEIPGREPDGFETVLIVVRLI